MLRTALIQQGQAEDRQFLVLSARARGSRLRPSRGWMIPFTACPRWRGMAWRAVACGRLLGECRCAPLAPASANIVSFLAMPAALAALAVRRFCSWLPLLLASLVAVSVGERRVSCATTRSATSATSPNAYAGRGFVWNAPPFQPVEAATSTLWPLLLLAVWDWFGVEPPDSVKSLGLVFGLATLFLLAGRLRRVPMECC